MQFGDTARIPECVIVQAMISSQRPCLLVVVNSNHMVVCVLSCILGVV